MDDTDAGERPSTRDLLSDKLDQMAAEAPVTEAPPAEEKVDATPEPAKAEAPEVKEPKPGRDAKGRFLKKLDEVSAKDAPQTPAPVASPEPPQAAEPPYQEPILAPRRLNAEMRAKFGRLPREAQEFFSSAFKDAETKISRDMQQNAMIRKRYEALETAISPYESEIVRAGGDPIPVLRSLFEWNRALERNPQDAIAQLAELYGVQVPTQGQTQLRQAAYHDPRVDELEKRYNMLSQSAQERELKSLNDQIESWKAENENGIPKWEYVAELEETMAQYLPHLRQAQPDAALGSLLAKAYRLALEDRPDISDAINAKREQQTKAKKQEEEKAKADKAKAAAVSPKGSGAALQPVRGKSQREILSMLLGENGHI